MRLEMAHRKPVTRDAAKEYRSADKTGKSRILDGLVQVTKRNRSYLSWLLRCWGTTVIEYRNGQQVRIVVGQRSPRRRVYRRYDARVASALREVWYRYGCMCGKRLVAVLRNQLPILEKYGAVPPDPQVRVLLQRISPATIDRLLQAEKRKLQLRGRSHTKPNTRLLHQIPIRTFTEWQAAIPGEVGADLVGHDGGIGGGEHLFTLLVTDRRTQWTEPRAVRNRAQKWVFRALLWIRAQMPFPLHALHTDCGGEFINNHLTRYCRQEGVRFTRGRPQRKNDNNFTEQKNNDIVRKHVGYLRLETAAAVAVLNQMYDRLRLLVNFCYPSQKLVRKVRQGARVRRVYDAPQTPYQRVLAASEVSEEAKERLRRQFEALNPVALQQEMEELQRRLWRMSGERTAPSADAG